MNNFDRRDKQLGFLLDTALMIFCALRVKTGREFLP